MTESESPKSMPDDGEIVNIPAQETPAGNTCWGVDPHRFDAAVERFPVLAYVIQAYFGSPVSDVRDAEFLVRYEAAGEDSAEFSGLLDDLTDAITNYRLAAVLVNGCLAGDLSDTDARAMLASLKDQITHQGDFAPPTSPREGDRYGIATSQQRINATWRAQRQLPFGWGDGRTYPLWAYLAFGVGLVLVGTAIVSYIPVRIIAGVGILTILVGAVISFTVALGLIGMAQDFDNPERALEREQYRRRRQADSSDDGDGKSPGLLSRFNPFGR